MSEETDEGGDSDTPAKAVGSRARAMQRPPGAPYKAERVDTCLRLMTGGQWVAGRTAGRLAAKWGMSEGTVEQDAAEASRAIKRSVSTDADEIRSVLVSQLQFLVRFAVKERRERSAIEAIRVMATLLGVNAPTKLEHAPGGSLADLLALPFLSTGKPDGEGSGSSVPPAV